MTTLEEAIARLKEAEADWIDRALSGGDVEQVLLILAEEIQRLKSTQPSTPALVLDGPPYFEDDQQCGYCQRPIGSKHEKWCRQ